MSPIRVSLSPATAAALTTKSVYRLTAKDAAFESEHRDANFRSSLSLHEEHRVVMVLIDTASPVPGVRRRSRKGPSTRLYWALRTESESGTVSVPNGPGATNGPIVARDKERYGI